MQEIPFLLDQRDCARFYRISRTRFYKLVHRPDVPTVCLGGRLFIARDAFEKWLLQQKEQTAEAEL